MNLAEINDCLNANAYGEKALVSKIYKILEACKQSQILMIGIYLIEKANQATHESS